MPAAEIGSALAAALAEAGAELCKCRDDWWVIGSAAMALHGAPVEVADIDILAAPGDAAARLADRGLPLAPGAPDGRFRSRLFGRWQAGAYSVELFAGFEVHGPDGWHMLQPRTRERRMVNGAALFVPAVDELIAWCRLFGRDKDGRRGALLQAMAAPHPPAG